ncbi:hypothetical protein [Pseudomonas veronii]|uniref:hypothetical protein n=1 Tax=Pseudomonas veronii TaxID=76761 RepID=UPI0007054984|nr:hypothetical protein [Pseudomonas veronii]CAD0264930.1 conserved exported hypothetical protein [Pseudomonas veronii]SEC41656.1 hypothetical protein SAMN04490199_5012 [Pseudomonas marginalis]
MNSDSVKQCVLTGFILLAAAVALPAHAGPHGGGHGGGPGWWGFGLGLGLGWEAARISTPYYYPTYPVYYYPAPTYYYPASPPTVVVEPQPVTAAPSAWYYCDSAKGYYPSVRQCPEGWRMVPATPPPGPIR